MCLNVLNHLLLIQSNQPNLVIFSTYPVSISMVIPFPISHGHLMVSFTTLVPIILQPPT